MSNATERAIFAQADELERLADTELDEGVSQLGACRRIWLVGTGSSQHAAELGAAMFAEAGLDAQARSAMDFVRFSPTFGAEDGVVLISHTAETAFALAARARAVKAGAILVAITGQNSGWAEAVETVPRESSETYTVSYTAALLVLARIAAALGAPAGFRDGIGQVAVEVRKALEQPDIEGVGIPVRALVLAGIGPTSVTAREGALKAREASRVLAEGYDAEYLLHGSAVPLGSEDRLVLLQPSEDPDGLLAAVGQAARTEGVDVMTVEQDDALHPLLSQIPLTVRLQLLALRFATQRAQNPDTVITGAWTEEELWTLGSADASPREAL